VITFKALGCVTPEVHASNVAHAWGLNPRRIDKWGNGPLAIVGGGPSLQRNLHKLSAYSEVWGINQIAPWLTAQGIPATMFSVDPQYQPTVGVERAILASCTHPQVFAELAGKDVRVFPMTLDEGEGWAALAGTTSACRAPLVALRAGFTRLDFYGCEGSFEAVEYVDGRDYTETELVVVRVGDKHFTTDPGLLLQCETLAELITEFPEFARDESGGLLSAMIACPKWETVALSTPLATRLYGDASGLADFTLGA
jgi:hypothetical protein